MRVKYNISSAALTVISSAKKSGSIYLKYPAPDDDIYVYYTLRAHFGGLTDMIADFVWFFIL